MALKVNFKVSGSGATTFSLDLEPELSVEEVKCLAMETCGFEPSQMKIIFKGRILKDTETVASVQVTTGSTMHIVRSAGNTTSSPTPTAPVVATRVTIPASVPQQAALATFPAAMAASPGMPADLGGMMGDPAMMQAAMQMMGGMGGGAGGGGMPDMQGMLGNPEFMQQMMQNPMVQQMMQNLSQNPQMLQGMIQNNPMIQQMSQNNPMLQQVLSNPQLLQTMMNPELMQSMMQMPQLMGGMGAPGAVLQTTDATELPGGAPNPTFNPAMMQQMMQAMGGMGGAGAVPAVADERSPEERFAQQVQQLENMGFPDKHSNLQALSQTNGDVNEAINALLAGV